MGTQPFVSLPALSMLVLVAGLAGCAAPPREAAAPDVVVAPVAAPADPTTAKPLVADNPATPAPVTVSTLALLETELGAAARESEMQISHTPDGELLLRATGDTAFASGSAALSQRFNQFLQRLAHALQSHPHLTARVTGHTDNVGNARTNDRLSHLRASATVSRLIALGVAPPRLLAEGKGQREPIASNETAAGRAANRRVDLLIKDSGG